MLLYNIIRSAGAGKRVAAIGYREDLPALLDIFSKNDEFAAAIRFGSPSSRAFHFKRPCMDDSRRGKCRSGKDERGNQDKGMSHDGLQWIFAQGAKYIPMANLSMVFAHGMSF